MTETKPSAKNTATLKIAAVSVMVIAAWAAGTPVQVSFTADQTGTVSAPVVGLGATSEDYFLVNPGGTTFLDKSFDGNNQEQFAFSNPSLAQDAASFNDNYMFQLGTDNNITKVNLTDGSLSLINGNPDIYLGAYSFGIGYDATANSIGIGNFNPHTSMMSFSKYDLGTGELTPLISFAFDTSTYGTPSGLDFVNMNGHLRMLIGTRDGEAIINNRPRLVNYVLDMNATNGSIDQYFTTGANNTLQDLLYEEGRLVLGYDRAGSGLIDAGDFTPIPEPATILLLGGDGQAVINYRVLNNTDSYSQSSAISAIYLKADGVVSVWICDETYPGWNAEPVDRSAGLDIDGSGFYDRGVALYSTDSGYDLMPGASLDFQIQSFYSHNLQDTSALLIKAGGGEDAPFRPLAKTAVCDQPADLNRDGVIDLADLAALAAYWLGPRAALYGEATLPGVVNLEDWAALARYWPGGIEND